MPIPGVYPKRQREDDESSQSPNKRRKHLLEEEKGEEVEDTALIDKSNSIAVVWSTKIWQGYNLVKESFLNGMRGGAVERPNRNTPRLHSPARDHAPPPRHLSPLLNMATKPKPISVDVDHDQSAVIDLTSEDSSVGGGHKSGSVGPKISTSYNFDDYEDEPDPLLLGDGNGGPSKMRPSYQDDSKSPKTLQPAPAPPAKPLYPPLPISIDFKSSPDQAFPKQRRPTLIESPRRRDRRWFLTTMSGKVGRERSHSRGEGLSGGEDKHGNFTAQERVYSTRPRRTHLIPEPETGSGSGNGSGSSKFLGRSGGGKVVMGHGNESEVNPENLYNNIDEYRRQVEKLKQCFDVDGSIQPDKNAIPQKPFNAPFPPIPSSKSFNRARKQAATARTNFRSSVPDLKGLDFAGLSLVELDQTLAEKSQELKKKTTKKWATELSEETEKLVEVAFRNRNFKAKCAKEQVEHSDLIRLRNGRWLNDEIINFYGAMIQQRSDEAIVVQDGQKRKKRDIHFFNSFFYKKLQEEGYEKSKLARWTKKIDIFSKDIVIFPINLGNAHWVCGAINFKDKRIEYFDSLARGSYPNAYTHLRQYLQKEHLDKKKAPFDFTGWENYFDPSSPQQTNADDCGIFTCQALELRARGIGDDGQGTADQWFGFSHVEVPNIRKIMAWEIMQQKLDARPT